MVNYGTIHRDEHSGSALVSRINEVQMLFLHIKKKTI